jgi:hypothetical protein
MVITQLILFGYSTKKADDTLLKMNKPNKRIHLTSFFSDTFFSAEWGEKSIRSSGGVAYFRRSGYAVTRGASL